MVTRKPRLHLNSSVHYSMISTQIPHRTELSLAVYWAETKKALLPARNVRYWTDGTTCSTHWTVSCRAAVSDSVKYNCPKQEHKTQQSEGRLSWSWKAWATRKKCSWEWFMSSDQATGGSEAGQPGIVLSMSNNVTWISFGRPWALSVLAVRVAILIIDELCICHTGRSHNCPGR